MKAAMNLVIATMLVVSATVLSMSLVKTTDAGPGWDEVDSDGHSRLVETLALEGTVRALEGNIGLLPSEAGEGDVLFLFPTYRPATGNEVGRVQEFVDQGGTLIIASDGQHARAWSQRLGVSPNSFPAILSSDGSSASDCVTVELYITSVPREICLPSPSAYLKLDSETHLDGITIKQAATSREPVFLDLDEDGALTLGDQGPQSFVMAVEWSYGNGTVFTIADGDLWRNGVLSDLTESANLQAARDFGRMVDAERGTIYLDSSAADAGPLSTAKRPLYASLSAPRPADIVLLGTLLVGIALLVGVAPRVPRWVRHAPDPDAVDEAVQSQAYQCILRDPFSSPSVVQRPQRPVRKTRT